MFTTLKWLCVALADVYLIRLSYLREIAKSDGV